MSITSVKKLFQAQAQMKGFDRWKKTSNLSQNPIRSIQFDSYLSILNGSLLRLWEIEANSTEAKLSKEEKSIRS